MKSPAHVMMKITGAMEVYGVAALKDLGVLVCVPGPLGERFYAGERKRALRSAPDMRPSGWATSAASSSSSVMPHSPRLAR